MRTRCYACIGKISPLVGKLPPFYTHANVSLQFIYLCVYIHASSRAVQRQQMVWLWKRDEVGPFVFHMLLKYSWFHDWWRFSWKNLHVENALCYHTKVNNCWGYGSKGKKRQCTTQNVNGGDRTTCALTQSHRISNTYKYTCKTQTYSTNCMVRKK